MKNRITWACALALLFVLGTVNESAAQQLIRKTNKSWKIHTGVFGGAGISNFIANSSNQNIELPTGYDKASMIYAPRLELRLGFFSEMETKCRFSFRLAGAYMMRSIPKPSFATVAQATSKAAYESIYLNGFMTDLTVFFNASSKFKVGIGFESTHFLLTSQLKEGDYAQYANDHKFTHGVKTVVGYCINPRTEINMYVLASNNTYDIARVNDISGGMNVLYRICGREIKVQKEVYKLDYSK